MLNRQMRNSNLGDSDIKVFTATGNRVDDSRNQPRTMKCDVLAKLVPPRARKINIAVPRNSPNAQTRSPLSPRDARFASPYGRKLLKLRLEGAVMKYYTSRRQQG